MGWRCSWLSCDLGLLAIYTLLAPAMPLQTNLADSSLLEALTPGWARV